MREAGSAVFAGYGILNTPPLIAVATSKSLDFDCPSNTTFDWAGPNKKVSQ